MGLVKVIGKPIFALFILVGLMGAIYYAVGNGPVPVTGNHAVYEQLREPLIATICEQGRTLTTDKQGSQLYEFTFSGYMTRLPYTVVMSRNVGFEVCAGCIGEWKEGMLSPPTYQDSVFISLDEFIVQMVRAKQNVFDTENSLAPMEWNAGSYCWRVTLPNKKGLWRIEVFDKRRTGYWEVYTRLESMHLPNLPNE